MNTHTHAPWKVRQAQNGKLGGIEVTTDKTWLDRDLICMMPHGPDNQKQAEANARLIAAAPELLQALEAATKLLEVSGMDDIGGGIRATIEAARAAITKAQG